MIAILVSLLPIIFYLRLFSGFFQQDEWLGFSQYVLHSSLNWVQLLFYFFLPSIGHFIPLTTLAVHSLFSLLGLNYQIYAGMSIFLHGVSILLFLYLAKLIFKDLKLAVLAVLVFGTLASDYQGTGWVIANLSTHGATIFGLLTIIFLFKENIKVSLFFLIVSLLFKEITLGLFILIPFYIFLFSKPRNWMTMTMGVAAFYVLVRVLMIFSPVQVKETTVFETQSTPKIVYNFVTVPFKSISQSIIPQGQIRWISEVLTKPLGEKIAGKEGSPDRERFVVKRTMEIVSLGLAGVIIWYALRHRSKIIIFSLFWIISNSLIFSLAPERTGLISTVDSRYLYFVSIGSALLLVSLFKDKLKFILVILVLINGFWLNKELVTYVQRGQVRRKILAQIKMEHPILEEKTVFYTESDTSFYGLPVEDRILPFQSGLGQTILSWYYDTEKFPKDFFENRYLWDILEQGYKEDENRGFGYFRDFDLMVKTVVDNKLPIDSVIGYRYSSKTNQLNDMTDEIKGRLKGSLSSKRKISSNHISTVSPYVTDGDKKTKWDSQVPYSTPQSFSISLDKVIKISQIEIDSYDNRNQDKVGYMIQLSEDGINWKQVFYAKTNPPKNDGIVVIPFLPTPAQYIKINQIGDHKFASWVIHELNVYESLD